VQRVDRGNPVRYDGENWYHVEDIQLGTTGIEIGRRQVLVRGRRLPRRHPRPQRPDILLFAATALLLPASRPDDG
jgi:hypothetical protein